MVKSFSGMEIALLTIALVVFFLLVWLCVLLSKRGRDSSVADNAPFCDNAGNHAYYDRKYLRHWQGGE